MSAHAGNAVFLSYASQDTEAAQRICEAMRAAGIEVWFDQSELVGGDAWDQKIRKQIGNCALFVPIVSANTQARAEGYFRLEWKLADRRTDLIGKSKAFLLPVCIDDTRDSEADVPDSFLAVQWTRLRLLGSGEASARTEEEDPALAKFVQRVKRLLEGGPGTRPAGGQSPGPDSKELPTHDQEPGAHHLGQRPRWLVPALVGAIGVAGALLVMRPWAKPSIVAADASAPSKPAPVTVSEARQLARRAFDPVEHGSPSREQLLAAEALCERALVLDPTDPEIWNIAARLDVRFIQGNFDTSPARRERAISRAAQVISLAPDLFESRLTRAYVLDSVATTDAMRADAESQLLALLKERPNDPTTLALLANLARKAGRFAESGDYYDRSGSPGGAAWSYYFGEDFARAEEATERSLRKGRTPSMITLKALLAEVHHEDVEAARAIFAEVPASALLQEGPASNAVRFALHARRPDEVIQLLGTLPAEYLSSAGFTGPKALLIGKAHEMAGRREAARASWQVALGVVEKKLAVTPNDPELLLQKAEVLACLGETAAAGESLRLATQLAGTSPDQITERTLPINVRLGHDDEALAFLTRTLTAREIGWRVLHATVRFDPDFDPLRRDPRLEKLLRDTLPEGARPFEDRKTGDGGQVTAGILAVDGKSVAVLAFANLSDDKANEYFSDGISEELLNVLAKVPGLKVSARTSAFYFKGKQVPIPEIARQLGVAYVVEGSVRKQGDKVRITAQLIKAADGFHVWSDTFTRDLKDVFAVQDEIAGLIAKMLEVKIGVTARGGSREVNPEALQLYLQGKDFLNQFSTSGAKRAIDLLQRAVEVDPQFAPAWAAMAKAGSVLGGYADDVKTTEEGYALARRAAEKAIALDPNLAAGYLSLTEVQSAHDFDWVAASASLQRARKLAPDDPAVLESAAKEAYAFGRIAESAELAAKAVALDPVNPALRVLYSTTLVALERHSEAEAQSRRVYELNATAPWGHAGLSVNLSLQGKFVQAAAEAALEANEWSRLLATALAEWGRKNTQAADAALAALIEKYAGVSAFQVAEVYAFRGENDRAFEWLERAYQQRDAGLAWCKSDPPLKNLHADPRWDAFMRKLGLADDQLK